MVDALLQFILHPFVSRAIRLLNTGPGKEKVRLILRRNIGKPVCSNLVLVGPSCRGIFRSNLRLATTLCWLKCECISMDNAERQSYKWAEKYVFANFSITSYLAYFALLVCSMKLFY